MMRNLTIKIISFLIALLALSASVFASSGGPFSIDLSVSKDTIFTGDTFNLILTLVYTSERGKVEIEPVEFPDLVEFEKVGTIQYSESQSVITGPITKKPEAEATYKFTRTYRALKPGEFQIPAVEVDIKDPSQPLGSLKTRSNTVTITVLDVSKKPPEERKKDEEAKKAEEEKGLRDIKAPVPAPMWILYLFGIGGSSILLALALVIARTLKPATKPPEQEKPRIIENPYDRAIAKLKELKPPTSGDDDDITLFYIRLTEIVKEYFAYHHGVMGFEATSYEITDEMRQAWMKYRRKDELISSLQSFLSDVDLGRYAKARREQNFMLTAIDKATKLINLDNEITRNVTQVS